PKTWRVWTAADGLKRHCVASPRRWRVTPPSRRTIRSPSRRCTICCPSCVERRTPPSVRTAGRSCCGFRVGRLNETSSARDESQTLYLCRFNFPFGDIREDTPAMPTNTGRIFTALLGATAVLAVVSIAAQTPPTPPAPPKGQSGGQGGAMGQAAETARKIEGGGVFAAGWTGKIDANEEKQGQTLNNAKLAK